MPPDSISLEISGSGVSQAQALADGSTSIGRSSQNDLVLDHHLVSRNHATIDRRGNAVSLVDLGSSNGTRVNGSKITPHAPLALKDGDVVGIEPFSLALKIVFEPDPQMTFVASSVAEASGNATIRTQAPPARAASRAGSAAPPVTTITIGRSPESDLCLEDPLVSRRHARVIFETPQRALIEDLGSSNGTFVESTRIGAGQLRALAPGTNVWLGNTHLVFDGTQLVHADTSKSARVDALDLNKLTSKGTNLLQNISLSIQPQEFVVIVGPSGAGKSTLLGGLSGLWPATGGHVYVNDVDLYQNFDALRTNIGFVPQDDIIHRELPVRASLDYAAQLRLPADTSAAERKERVSTVVDVLGLSERQDVPVGNLSGGQRKRVSIGVELLTSPGLFFLDEATSGLDPGTEAQLMRMLRGLADEGHTILLVTHATKNVTMCDQVVFLARGGYLAYFGPPAEALTYFGVDDFDGIYEKLDGELTPQEWGSRFRRSALYTTYVQDRLEPRGSLPASSGSTNQAGTVSTSPRFFSQLSVLSNRYLDIIRRDRVNLALMLLLAPLLGAVDLLAWPSVILDPVEGDLRRSLTMLFLSSLIPFLVGAMSSIREVVKEGPIYRRERAAGLGVLPYVVSKTWIMGLFALYDALAFVAIKYLAIDFGGLGFENVLQLYGTVFLAVFSGSMWGLVMSAIVPREDRAMHLLAAVIVLQMVFSGGLLPLGKLGPPGVVLGGVTSVNWALRGSAAALELDTQVCLGEEAISSCSLPGIQKYETAPERLVVINVIEEDFGDVLGSNVYETWIGMVSILGVLFIVFAVLQKLKDRAT